MSDISHQKCEIYSYVNLLMEKDFDRWLTPALLMAMVNDKHRIKGNSTFEYEVLVKNSLQRAASDNVKYDF